MALNISPPEFEDNRTQGQLNEICQAVIRVKKASKEMRRGLNLAWSVYVTNLKKLRLEILLFMNKSQESFINSFPDKARFWWRQNHGGINPLLYSDNEDHSRRTKENCQSSIEDCNEYVDVHEYENYIQTYGDEIHRNESEETLTLSYLYQDPPPDFKKTPMGIYDEELNTLSYADDRFNLLATYKRPFYSFIFHMGERFYRQETEASDCSEWQRECTQVWVPYTSTSLPYIYGPYDYKTRNFLLPCLNNDIPCTIDRLLPMHRITQITQDTTPPESLDEYPVTSLNFRRKATKNTTCYSDRSLQSHPNLNLFECLFPIHFQSDEFNSYHIHSRQQSQQSYDLFNNSLSASASLSIQVRESLLQISQNSDENSEGRYRCATWGEPIVCKKPRKRKRIKINELVQYIRENLHFFRRNLSDEIEIFLSTDEVKQALLRLSQARLILETFSYGGYNRGDRENNLQFDRLMEILEKAPSGFETELSIFLPPSSITKESCSL